MRQVGAARLLRPPAVLHDHGHRLRRGTRGVFVFVLAVLQAALDDPVVREKRRWPALQDLLLGQHRDPAVAGPLQRLRDAAESVRDTAGCARRSRGSPPRGRPAARIARGAERFWRIGENRSGHHVCAKSSRDPAEPMTTDGLMRSDAGKLPGGFSQTGASRGRCAEHRLRSGGVRPRRRKRSHSGANSSRASRTSAWEMRPVRAQA